MMIAAWPTAKNVPNVLVAIEFDTPEEAAKFEPQLNDVLRKVLPPTATPTPSPQGAELQLPTVASASRPRPAADTS